MTVGFAAAAARLDVILAHEADDVANFDAHVAAVVTNARDGGDPVPRAFDLRPCKAPVVKQELRRSVAVSMNDGRFGTCQASHHPACSRLHPMAGLTHLVTGRALLRSASGYAIIAERLDVSLMAGMRGAAAWFSGRRQPAGVPAMGM